MANQQNLRGFVPVANLDGSNWVGRGNVYYVPSSDTSAYACGDPVLTVSGADANGVPQCSIGLAGTPARGIVIRTTIATPAASNSLSPAATNRLNMTYSLVPAIKNAGYYLEVIDLPQMIFEIQEGGGGTPLTASAVNMNCNFLAAPSDRFMSQYCLDNTTIGTSSAMNLKILGLARRDDNTFGLYAKWWVLLNSHELI